MSLVSDALKKAEREAAAREAREKGQPVPFEAPLQPYRSTRSRRPRALLLAALCGGTLVFVLAGVWWSSARRIPVPPAAPDAPPVPEASRPLGATTGGPTTQPERPSATPTPGAGAPAAARPQAPQPKAEPVARDADAEAPPPSRPAHVTTSLAPSPSAPAPPPASARPLPPAATPAAAAEPLTRSFGPGDYLLRAELPDGSKLDLGGIVYSETSPFAFLNGRLVGVGEFVAGRRIDRIERDRVILSGEGGSITLRLKAP